MIKVTKIEIIPIKPQKGLLAFANFVIDDNFYMTSVAIHSKFDGSGYRITYPKKKDYNLFYPINKETSKIVENAIINEFKNVMNIQNDRYNSAFDTSR